MLKILIVEDDKSIVKVIKDYFERREFTVDYAGDGYEGEDKAYEGNYDLILLDVMMPKKDGFELCRDIRSRSEVPIIFITARERTEDVLNGYSLGCDDYIVKPFSLETLYAKCMALVKRDKGLVGSKYITAGNIMLNPLTLEVKVEERKITLPDKEFQILKLLMDNKGKVVSREEMLNKVWGYDYEGTDRVLDNRIKNLRHLLGKEGKCIRTVIRRGYRIEGID